MSKHTPGPWYVSGVEIMAQYQEEGDTVSRWVATISAGQSDVPRQIDYDNACLIAAAPELLNEAEAAHGVLCGCTTGEICGAPSLFAVIRKARGRS